MSASPPTAPDSPSSCKESCSALKGDSDPTLCPVSRTIGTKVGLISLKALLEGSALRRLAGKEYRFCPARDCDVVYFDRAADSIFRKRDVIVRIGLKESEDPVPVCYCFDFTMADLRRDITARGDTDIPERITAEVRAGRCACEVKNPEGSCCLANVWEAVMRIRSNASAHSTSASSPG